MPTSLWRALALFFGTVALIVALIDTIDVQQYTNSNIDSAPVAADGYFTVMGVEGSTLEHGDLRVGDRIAPAGGRLTPRDSISAWPAGTVQHWSVIRGQQHFTTSTIVTPPSLNDMIYAEVVNAFRLGMIGLAIVIILRRPDAPEARALATFFIAFGLAAYLVPSWLPDPLLHVAAVLRGPILLTGVGYATLFACLFPTPSETGIRAVIRRVALPLTALIALASLAVSIARNVFFGAPDVSLAGTILQDATYAMLGLMVFSFVIGTISARGLDLRRALWASGSIIVGFSGIVAYIVAVLLDADPWWLRYTQLTIIAIPLGLAYTILRHRTIDVGFVISRALVLTAISFIVIGVFGLLERTLGKLFIDQSHIASRTVEIALAIGLGFSLRTLHVRVEHAVDYVFFRGRQQSLAALRAFQRDVFYISDPDLVVERAVALISRHADAAAVTIAGEQAAQSDDPVFVRLRATHEPVRLRGTGTELHGELAFPMAVRGTLTGALIVAAKRSGETYDPVERELLAEIAERTGIALDALRTQAIRAELEALRAATGGALSAF